MLRGEEGHVLSGDGGHKERAIEPRIERFAACLWHEHASNLGLPFDVYMRTPIVSGSEVTHSYFVTHEDAAAYGSNVSAWRTHPDTAAIDSMLGQVQSCTNALWQSWQVISAE